MALTHKKSENGYKTRRLLCRYEPVKELANQLDKLKQIGEATKEMSYKGDLVVTLFGYLHLLKKYKCRCVFMKDLRNPGLTWYVKKVFAEKNFGAQLMKCIESGEKIIVIPVLVQYNANGKAHQTILILKPEHKTLEFYNSLGSKTFPKVLQRFFENIIEGLRYISPDVLCSVAFQKEEEKIKRKTHIELGYCQIWSLFIMELVLKYPRMETSDILNRFWEGKKTPAFYRSVVVGYAKHISEEINLYLKKVNLTLGLEEVNILKYEIGNSASSSYNRTILSINDYVAQEIKHILT